MTADLRALITELADALDHGRQCLMDDRRLIHPLADKARAALARLQPEPPTQRQLLQLAAEFWPEGAEPTQAVPYARAVLDRWGNS